MGQPVGRPAARGDLPDERRRAALRRPLWTDESSGAATTRGPKVPPSSRKLPPISLRSPSDLPPTSLPPPSHLRLISPPPPCRHQGARAQRHRARRAGRPPLRHGQVLAQHLPGLRALAHGRVARGLGVRLAATGWRRGSAPPSAGIPRGVPGKVGGGQGGAEGGTLGGVSAHDRAPVHGTRARVCCLVRSLTPMPAAWSARLVGAQDNARHPLHLHAHLAGVRLVVQPVASGSGRAERAATPGGRPPAAPCHHSTQPAQPVRGAHPEERAAPSDLTGRCGVRDSNASVGAAPDPDVPLVHPLLRWRPSEPACLTAGGLLSGA